MGVSEPVTIIEALKSAIPDQFVTFAREADTDHEIRFGYSHGILIAQERYYPDKHGNWSAWYVLRGFTIDVALADDWVAL